MIFYPEDNALSLVLPITDQLLSHKNQFTILTQPLHVLFTLK